jgi:hypothetical protein
MHVRNHEWLPPDGLDIVTDPTDLVATIVAGPRVLAGG